MTIRIYAWSYVAQIQIQAVWPYLSDISEDKHHFWSLHFLPQVQCEHIRILPQMRFHSVVVLHVCLVFLFVHTFLYKIPIIFHLLFLHYLFIKRSSLKVKATISLQLRDT